jgi:hypothetical protein
MVHVEEAIGCEHRRACEEDMLERLRDWTDGILWLKALSDKSTNGFRSGYQLRMEKLRIKYQAASLSLEALKDAGNGRWEKTRAQADQAMGDLRDAINEAALWMIYGL